MIFFLSSDIDALERGSLRRVALEELTPPRPWAGGPPTRRAALLKASLDLPPRCAPGGPSPEEHLEFGVA